MILDTYLFGTKNAMYGGMAIRTIKQNQKQKRIASGISCTGGTNKPMENIMAQNKGTALINALAQATKNTLPGKVSVQATKNTPPSYPKLSDKPYVRLILVDKNKTAKTVQSGAYQALKIALDNGFNITCDKNGYTHLIRWAYRHFTDKKENYVREYKLDAWYKTTLLPAYERVTAKDWPANKGDSFTLTFPKSDK